MRSLIFLLLLALLILPATPIMAQDDTTISPQSGRYELTIPADWSYTTQQIRGLEGIFVDEIVVVGDSPAALTSLADITPTAQRTGKTLIANIFPKGLALRGEPDADANTIFNNILGASAEGATFFEANGLPAVRTRDYFGPPYTSATLAGQTMVLHGELIYFIVYSAPDEAGMAELEAIAATMQVKPDATVPMISTSDLNTRPDFVTTDGRLTLPLAESWMVAQSGAGAFESFMVMTEPDGLLPFIFSGAVSETTPGLLIQVNAEQYASRFGTSDTTVTDEDRLALMDEILLSLIGVPEGEIESMTINGVPALKADLVSAFESDTNRGTVILLDPNQSLYTIAFIGPADRWEADYVPLIDAMLAGLTVAAVDEGDVTGIQVGQTAPDFELSALDGGTLRLSDLRGQTVIVNFWATWCPPCRVEMPDFQTAYEQNDGFTILAVNMMETEEATQAFVDELGLSFPIAMDRDGQVTNLYDIAGYPTSYLIDGAGVIRDMNIGPLSGSQIQEWIALAQE